MTPKEKADELLKRFKNCDEGGENYSAIKCSRVVCKQVINELGKARALILASIKDTIGIDNYFTGEINWWSHVEEEIRKL